MEASYEMKINTHTPKYLSLVLASTNAKRSPYTKRQSREEDGFGWTHLPRELYLQEQKISTIPILYFVAGGRCNILRVRMRFGSVDEQKEKVEKKHLTKRPHV